ncbi:DUF4007 family protein [Pseudomonas fluorescens]|jgi:hypothetical protein|uniref:DUF4007 family protein n=1 Tax=Pseudomonas fluorescens TaxID=294 RepID=UPI002783E003|nr:DUF4007 family protein [Pseudomonas fluorescens]MDP9784874.1 hypothetical protein [Pseudomonas fluorescens]
MITLRTDQRPQFSGHETFPLRQLWLRKAYDAVAYYRNLGLTAPKSVFSEDAAIARFGVGKNMVTSIRFWATACRVIEESEGGFVPTQIADTLFDPQAGLDPFSEHTATTWLMHWFLASSPEKTTTWYYLFNHVVQQVFKRESVVESLSAMITERNLKISGATLKRDVECCIRSYVPRLGGESPEEMSEPLLGELGLVQQNTKDSFEFRRGAKRSLPDGVFAYALLDYWERLGHSGSVMAFDRVAHDYGSPGRVFKLDEHSVADRLMALEDLSKGQLLWTEQAGIRQVTRQRDALSNIKKAKENLLQAAYAKK